MGGTQGKLGPGPTPAQTEWAAAAGASSRGLTEYTGLVKTANGTRVADADVQRSGAQIGAGQFGAVSRGTYRGREVAIKSIALSGTAYASGQQSIDEFFRQVRLEIATMSELGTHPNCMQFFGSTSHFPHAGEGAGALLIELLLELMPNGTLFDNLHMKQNTGGPGRRARSAASAEHELPPASGEPEASSSRSLVLSLPAFSSRFCCAEQLPPFSSPTHASTLPERLKNFSLLFAIALPRTSALEKTAAI